MEIIYKVRNGRTYDNENDAILYERYKTFANDIRKLAEKAGLGNPIEVTRFVINNIWCMWHLLDGVTDTMEKVTREKSDSIAEDFINDLKFESAVILD